jgi:hypothetical protein
MNNRKLLELRWLLGVLFILLVLSETSYGQKAPIKYGDIDLADLQMQTYDKDTSAVAVVLCDYGIFSSTLLKFEQITRIKILKKEGYSLANYTIPGKFQYDVKAMTVNLVDGKIVKNKVKSESIYVNKVTFGEYETRIALSDVKVGSILEINYAFNSIPAIWNFQKSIPVRYSELVMESTPYLRFKSNFFGYEPLAYSSINRWVAKDMPAFKPEPFINSSENYITKREFDILEINYIPYAATWEDINTKLSSSHGLLFLYPASSQIADEVKLIRNSKLSKEKMLREAFEFAKTIVWNERMDIYTSDNTLSNIMKQKTGNSADVNSILYELLSKLDFEVKPVVLSSRDNGVLSQFSASLFKLNYMIVQVHLDDKYYLLDATEKYAPFYLLPLRCLNSTGRLIDETNPAWVDLTSVGKDKEIITYDLSMDDNLTLNGTMTVNRSDYAALDFRKKFRTFNSQEEFLNDFSTNKTGLIINKYTLENLDSLYLPVFESYDIKINNRVITADNQLIVQPLFFNAETENPFKLETRKYPIDFGYKRESTIISRLKIPEGYSLKSLPLKVIVRLNDNSGSFTYDTQVDGNKIIITSKLLIDKPHYEVNEYQELRKLFTQMIKKHGEPVIFEKAQ